MGTFSAQYPPTEWFNPRVVHLHSVATQTRAASPSVSFNLKWSLRWKRRNPRVSLFDQKVSDQNPMQTLFVRNNFCKKQRHDANTDNLKSVWCEVNTNK